jgi:hypothetical protein
VTAEAASLTWNPTGFDFDSDRGERDGWFDESTVHLTNLNLLLTVAPVGMWSKASISPPSELAREAGEAESVSNADRPHIHRPPW